MQRMGKKIYSEHWEKETESLNNQGIYQTLSKITPKKNTIEIGCGTGVTSRYLASDRKVLSIDNNEHLIEKTSQTLKDMESPPTIIHADIFELTSEILSSIRDFSPIVVTGWFIGSHADDIDKRTDPSLAIYKKPKLYRESIEDIIVGKIGAIDTVEWVHLANRGEISALASEQQIIQATVDEYNARVFSPNGFEVEEVKLLKWDRNRSNFMYVNSPNQNYKGEHTIPVFISILAKRKKT
ncbi:class I SAM-dependent methyltransferase [uncultured Tolumonas sp.]|uniref:class I SAM-dependent methyltransferase n=1 Tax=uncultured Tolumonas sp. TaxID=263765 RepID=UPI002931D619|nr:class I SAM-dependent methyltransferase [uncultured Tolumonas sp.]